MSLDITQERAGTVGGVLSRPLSLFDPQVASAAAAESERRQPTLEMGDTA